MTRELRFATANFTYEDLTSPEGPELFRRMNDADAARGSQGGCEAIQGRNNQLRKVMQPAWETEFRRVAFMATNGKELVESYGPIPSIGYGVIRVPETTLHITIDDVVADVVKRFDAPLRDLAPAGVEGGFGGQDIAVWHNDKLLAVVRRGADGKPEVTRFEAPETDQDRGASGDER